MTTAILARTHDRQVLRRLNSAEHGVGVDDSDAAFLKRAGVNGFDDPNYERLSRRLARLRGIRKYTYRMDVPERKLSCDEVTEISFG